jgi:hypothetical protein
MLSSFHDFDFAPAKNFIKKKPPRLPLNFSASQRRQKIARSFNCGFAFQKQIKPRQGRKKIGWKYARHFLSSLRDSFHFVR